MRPIDRSPTRKIPLPESGTVAGVPALSFMFATAAALTGPADQSRFDAAPYKAQKALYDFNFAKPSDALGAFGYVRNYRRAIEEYGDPKNSRVVIVAHGNEHA